ncbi:MAG: hypothetical protein Q7K42_00600 [Candidatus Diapherotrites archaeon]|nr:hypothetical protein [Candidatus Diapherotrites archaeon]
MFGCVSEPVKTADASDEYHVHADFLVVLNGEAKDFSLPEFQSNKPFNSTESDKSKSPLTHLHDGKGNVVHVHAKGVTWKMFFESIGMNINGNCFTDEKKDQYCSMRYFVNGEEFPEIADKEILDLDRVLITYPLETEENALEKEIQKELAQVTDEACIPSGKCLERGTPEDESSCITGEKCVE